MYRHRLAFTLAFLIAITAVAAYAALPTFWQVSTEADFLRGDVENLAIDSFGRLMLGPTSTPLYDSSAPFLWTVVTGLDGSIYCGSGNEGVVYKIDPSGRGSTFFDAEELEVHAIAAAPGGGLYVGTSPDGKIYKVDPSGKGTVFFDPGDRYIWSLVVDRAGNVFAATGDKGVIYKITPDGKGAPFYATKATHAMTLAFDREGRLLAGTESPGRVFRIDNAGKAFVLLDSSYNEVRSLRVDGDGNIYVAAVSGRPPGAGSDRAPSPAPSGPEPASGPALTPNVTTEITVVAVADSAPQPIQTGGGPPARGGPTAGAIFRIVPDGASDQIWESREDLPYDVAFEPGGSVLVATGNKGKIYRLSGDPLQPTLVARANAQQITSIVSEREGRVLLATSNPGKLIRLGAARADRGTYTSDVRDAQTVALWGTIKWQDGGAGGRVEIATRSGNTRTPDDTWSDWSPVYSDRDGSQISSPRARYLQWRAVLVAARGESPVLTSVTAAYLPRNLRPRVTSITVQPPGTVFQRPFPTDPEIAGFEGDPPDRRAASPGGNPSSSPSLGRRQYQKGLLTFIWRAEDDNRDELTYDVSYRREGETSWKPLKSGLNEAILVWDTTSVPNGRYLVRVVASDAPSNSAATALSGALESISFEIDNTPPAITVSGARRDGNRLTITFEARDGNSAIQKAEYSLDGDRWQTVYPKDGISDSKYEQFELSLDGTAPGRGVMLRVSDALNNVAGTEVPTPAATTGSGRR
jgi:sugar lactone lactonase YvrE